MKIKTFLFFFIVLLTPCLLKSQGLNIHEPGKIELGMRSTISAFSDDKVAGIGTGGQFRIMLAKRLNTEWFADFLQSELKHLGKRNSAHIGWSVMFYLKDKPKIFDPYLIAGHCFDFTKVTPYNNINDNRSGDVKKRWSSAAQIGFGNHFHVSDHFNITTSVQYMLHLGNNIEANIIQKNNTDYLEVKYLKSGNNLTLEGHLLITLSLNLRIADLW